MRLSIITPVYNAKATLPRTLDSISRAIDPKNRAHVQVVLVDDGSTDGSAAIVDAALETLTGFDVTVRRQSNAGAAVARNTALNAATGQWLFLLDADDELLFDPVAFLDAQAGDSEPVSAYVFNLRIYKNGQPHGWLRPRAFGPEQFLDVFTAGNVFQPSCLMFRRDAVDRRFTPGVACVEDWVFWAMNERLFARLRATGMTSAALHIHGQNISAQHARAGAHRIEAARRIAEHFGDGLTRTQRHNLLLQEACGMLQQRRWPGAGAFFLWPCSAVLYLKLWVYAVAAAVGVRASPY